jgi:mono/diheme cytochrome c family protein
MTARIAFASALAAAVLAMLCTRPAEAVPIFAERYGFSCAQCHTAVPDLNAFGKICSLPNRDASITF